MRMILLQLGLALSLLARGPFCDVLCEAPAVEVAEAAPGQHGMTDDAPCHSDSSGGAKGSKPSPVNSHDSCSICEDLILASIDPPPAGAWIDLRVSRSSVHESPSQAARQPLALSSPRSGQPEPPDILLLKSTLLI
ncbi:MAG: hypothetical protein GY937_03090 [bacterium]|nr:hypothetical protein [bacterium]